MTTSSEDERKLEGIRTVNGCLNMLANDVDLQSDLAEPMVKIAIEHWSGSNRMPSETYTKKLAQNLRVQSVYPKIKMLQNVCQNAKMGIPLDHLLEGKRELDTIVLTRAYGTDFCIKHNLTRPLTPIPPKRGMFDDDANEGPLSPTPKTQKHKPNNAGQQVDGLVHSSNVNSSSSSSSSNSTPSSSASAPPPPPPPLIDLWRVFKDSMRNAEWKEIFLQVFQQQALAFVAALLVAYALGYLPVDDLLTRLFRR